MISSPLIVFDLDGTLVDSAPDLLATLDAIFPRHGYASPSDPTLRDGIGHGARYLIEYALHRQQVAIDTPKLDVMHRDFLGYYETHICDASQLYPGAVEMLERFGVAGWSVAVCTNKLEGLSRLVLEKLGVLKRFRAVCGGDTFGTRKPDPEHLLRTIAAADGSSAASIMIGDSRPDIDTARAAGVPVVGVTYGYTPIAMPELAPDLMIDSFDELTPELARGLLSGMKAKRLHTVNAIPAAP